MDALYLTKEAEIYKEKIQSLQQVVLGKMENHI